MESHDSLSLSNHIYAIANGIHSSECKTCKTYIKIHTKLLTHKTHAHNVLQRALALSLLTNQREPTVYHWYHISRKKPKRTVANTAKTIYLNRKFNINSSYSHTASDTRHTHKHKHTHAHTHTHQDALRKKWRHDTQPACWYALCGWTGTRNLRGRTAESVFVLLY